MVVFGIMGGQTGLEEDEDVWLQQSFDALYVRRQA